MWVKLNFSDLSALIDEGRLIRDRPRAWRSAACSFSSPHTCSAPKVPIDLLSRLLSLHVPLASSSLRSRSARTIRTCGVHGAQWGHESSKPAVGDAEAHCFAALGHSETGKEDARPTPATEMRVQRRIFRRNAGRCARLAPVFGLTTSCFTDLLYRWLYPLVTMPAPRPTLAPSSTVIKSSRAQWAVEAQQVAGTHRTHRHALVHRPAHQRARNRHGEHRCSGGGHATAG